MAKNHRLRIREDNPRTAINWNMIFIVIISGAILALGVEFLFGFF